MGYIIKTTEGMIDLEEYAKQQHLPFDWQQILNRGFFVYDYKNRETPVIHHKELPELYSPAYFVLVGEGNLGKLQDPNYKFTNILEYLNAVEFYTYACLKSNMNSMMDKYFIAVINSKKGRVPYVISRAFRRYINY
ncbi:MAG: hypothetical protein HeimC2_44090 [Candidatus Heimdallarchaeota archaeon LC_2]|nr:MAG: hypothetical protein HeimC2_44090 [Candidatus Heimdallarchaeota archaeon LC_2]